MAEPKQGFCWHVHHNVLLEWCWDIDYRAGVIKDRKPPHEVATRLHLFRPVTGRLPDAVLQAGTAYEKTRRAFAEVWMGRINAGIAYAKANDAKANDAKVADDAKAASEKARASCGEAERVCNKVGAVLDGAILNHRAEIEALHAKECGCKEWNGTEIVFPKAQEK